MGYIILAILGTAKWEEIKKALEALPSRVPRAKRN